MIAIFTTRNASSFNIDILQDSTVLDPSTCKTLSISIISKPTEELEGAIELLGASSAEHSKYLIGTLMRPEGMSVWEGIYEAHFGLSEIDVYLRGRLLEDQTRSSLQLSVLFRESSGALNKA